MTYGNAVPLAQTYTNRMQVSNYKLTSTSTQMSMDIDYTYSADGRLKLSTDHKDATLDRAYKYDQVGRLAEAFTASEARSWVQTGNIGTTVDGPYRQSYTYDAWDNMTTKWGRSWVAPNSRTETVNHTYSATTGRNDDLMYDADGRMTGDIDNGTDYIYDEAGGLREVSNSTSGTLFTQDGDGQKTKMVVEGNATHYLRSSVLGQTIAEIEGADGSRKNGFVYANGQLIATQVVGIVFWQHMDASQRSRRTTLAGGGGQGRDEVDPMDVKLDPPNLHQFNQGSGGGGKSAGGAEARIASLMDLRMCDFAGMLVPCGIEESLRGQVGQSPGELQLFWEHGLWFGEGYVPNYGTIFIAVQKIDPILLIEFMNGEIDASEIREMMMASGFMPLAFTQDKKKPKKTRLRSKLPDYAKDVYKGKLGRTLTKCINEVFNKFVSANRSRNGIGAMGNQLLGGQTSRNAPKIIFEDTGDLGGTRPEDGTRGVVRISDSQIVNTPYSSLGRTVSAYELGQRTYVHELGNYLASKIVAFDYLNVTGPEDPNLNLNFFGDPNGIRGEGGRTLDRDTGARLEKCVFQSVVP